MALNFTVIFSSKQQFGGDPNIFGSPEVFVGQTKDFSFDCPDVGASETAFLLFQSLEVTAADNVFEINGKGVFGGIPVSPDRTTSGRASAAWAGNIMLVEPRHNLQAAGNVLHVQAATLQSGVIDNFILDNMVIVYKIGPPGGHGGGHHPPPI
jgi:hypothetical protein